MLEAKCEPGDEDPPQGELGILSVNSLRRSVSQVMDGKSLTGDDDVWDPNISGHDSGMVRERMLCLFKLEALKAFCYSHSRGM